MRNAGDYISLGRDEAIYVNQSSRMKSFSLREKVAAAG